MSFLNRNSIAGKMFLGLACVAMLAMLVAAARPFEPSSTLAASAQQPDQVVVSAGR